MLLVDGLIISAGYSQRMPAFKPLMNYHGVPFMLGILLKMARGCENICVVTGHRSPEIRKNLIDWFARPPKLEWLEFAGIDLSDWMGLASRVNIIFNPEYDRGMLTSLQTGLRSLNSGNWVLYHFVDQPHLPISFYHHFLEQTEPVYDWVQPQFNNRNGHPLLLNPGIFDSLKSADATEGLNKLAVHCGFRKKFWKCTYPEILTDFDTIEDLINTGVSDENI